MPRWAWGFCLSLASVLGSASALAQGPVAPDETERAAEDRRRAAVMLDRSAIAYREGRYDAAATLLEEAYLLSHEPILLYNLGRAYEGAGDPVRAIEAYDRFLREAGDPPSATTVRAWIARLETGIREAREEETARADEARAREAREHDADRERLRRAQLQHVERATSPLPWVVAGVGAATLASGVVLGIVAGDRHGSAQETAIQRDAAALEEDAMAFATAANVTLALGGAITAVGVTWAIVVATEPRPALDVAVGPGSIAVRGTF